MPYFLPGQESLQEIFSSYIARGLRFEVKPDAYFGCYALKVQFTEGSNAAPVFPLPPMEMQTPEAAQRWLEQLRDTKVAMLARGMVG